MKKIAKKIVKDEEGRRGPVVEWTMKLCMASSIAIGVIGSGCAAAWAAGTPRTTLRPPSMSCTPTCEWHPGNAPRPEITSVSPLTVSPGEVVTVTGEHFGPKPGYVDFADNSVNWGGPGDAAPLAVFSWDGSEIKFGVPGSSGPWTPVGGTQATITVTSAEGATSAPAFVTVSSNIVWPVKTKSEDTRVGDGPNGYMQTAMTVSDSGELTATTHAWDQSPFGTSVAFYGSTVVTLYNSVGSPLGQYVGGPWTIRSGENHTFTWHDPVGAKVLDSIYSVSVVNFSTATSAPASVLAWILANSSSLYSQARVVP